MIGVVVGAGGSVRAFYGRRHHVEHLESKCGGGACAWQSTKVEEYTDVRVGWVDEAGQGHTALVVAGAGNEGSVAVDPGGRIHMVLDYVWAGIKPFRHYLIGPGQVD